MKLWLFCRECAWQAETPFDSGFREEVTRTRGALCPSCHTSLLLMEFDRRTWMKVGADLLVGKKRVLDFLPTPKSPKTRRED